VNFSFYGFGRSERISHAPPFIPPQRGERISGIRRFLLLRKTSLDFCYLSVLTVVAYLDIPRHFLEIFVGESTPAIDALIAATAICHGLTVATRNTQDMQHSGAKLYNPWE